MARGKTRWPGKNTNVQSPLFEKIQYPTPFKKGRKKERKKRKGSSPSKFVEKSNVWTMIHAINAWQTTAEKVFSQSRCEGERKEGRVSGGRFKPGFESNSSVSLSRYMPEEGVFRSRYGQRWIDRERGRTASIRSIYPSLSASLETQSVKSQPDRLTQFTGHRSHRDMYTRQSECALT